MIYTIKRNGVVIFTHEIKGARTQSAPAVDFVDVEFDFSEAILFKNNDTIEFDGQTYYCDKQYNSVLKRGTNLYNHRARFLSSNYRATEIALLDAHGLSTFEIEGNLLTLLTLAETNLNRLSSGWSYDTPPTTITKTFQIDGMNVMEFLARVSSEFEIPFYIQDKVIYFKDPDLVYAGGFAYGKGNGLIDIRKSYKSGEKIPNTVYATGGDGLVLDTPVINSGNISENGVIEGFYENENIKPTTRVYMEGVVSADNVVTTTQINYDIQAQKIAGQTPLINFETGALGGLSFYITNSTYDTNTNVTVIYLKKRTVDGVLLPNNTVRALAGDYFNITNIKQPQAIIDEALFKLEQYATSDMNRRILNNEGIEATLDPLFPEDLKLNDSINVFDSNLELLSRLFILEIKTDLQNLNKKDIVLGKDFRYLNIPGLNVKNDNIIDLGIQNNYDDLVVIEEEIIVIDNKLDGVVGDLNNVTTVVIPELNNEIGIVRDDLLTKEDVSNKVGNLEVSSSISYPNTKAVIDALGLKQNKLTPSPNVSIVNDVISVKVNNTTQTTPSNPVTNNPNSTYAVQNDTNGNLVVNVPLSSNDHLPVTIVNPANGLSVNASQGLSLGIADGTNNGAMTSGYYNQLIALAGLQFEFDQVTATLIIKDGNNVVLTSISLIALNNEGTQFVYNPTTETLDLYNDQGVLLSSVPVSSFVANLVSNANWNGTIPYRLDFKDNTGTTLFSIDYTISNIQGLQAALDSKLDVRMADLVSNLSNSEKTAIHTKLGITNNVTQVLGGSGNTVTLSGGGGSYTVPYTDWANIPNKPTTFTPSAHTHPTSQITALTGYVLGTNTALSATDSLNVALGKIQAQINAKTSNVGTVTSITAGTGLSGGTINTSGTIALNSATIASLAKADTALQVETDPTVPAWVKGITTGDITNWNSKQTALTDGLHTILNGNKVDVTFNTNTHVYDKSGFPRLYFSDTAPNIDMLFRLSQSAGQFTFRNSVNGQIGYLQSTTGWYLGQGNYSLGAQTSSAISRDMGITSGGWARYTYEVLHNGSTVVDRIGHYGSADVLNYGFIGGTLYNTKSAIRWTSNGFVGIGLQSTNAPSYPLHISSDQYVSQYIHRTAIGSNGSAIGFGNATGYAGDVGFGVINNDFTVRGASGNTLFKINQANNVPSFPNLPGVQTGTTGNLAYINASGEIWRHQLTIGDLITTGNIGGYIPAAQTLVTNTSSVISNTGGYVGITGGNDITISSVGRNNLIDRNDLTNFGAGLFPFYNTTGSVNYPSAVGGGMVLVRNTTNNSGGNIMLWTGVGVGVNENLYYTTSNSSGWQPMKMVASTEYVINAINTAGGNYMTTNTNQLTLAGNKQTTGWWHYAFRSNNWYNDDLGNPRIYIGTNTNNGFIFRLSDAVQQFQFRDTANTIVAYINNLGQLTASQLRIIGGTSSQFLKADGSVDSNTYALASSIITPNNGLLTISTSSDLTGGGTFSADQATASNVSIGLSSGTLASLALANTAVQPSALGIYVNNVANSTSFGRVYARTSGNIYFTGIPVIDTRNTGNGLNSTGAGNYVPLSTEVALNSTLTPLFHMGSGSYWLSSLIIKGWTSNYGAWMITGNAHNTGTFKDKYYLNSTEPSTGVWGTPVEIIHSGNISTFSPAQVNIIQGAGISVTGTYPNLTITNTAPNVQSDWNATSGLAQILNKPTIPTVGNGQLSFTAPTGLNITGTFNANQSGNTTIPITWQTGYQGFTTAESTKLAGIQAGATVPNNGTFTVQGVGAITGGGSTSADASANTSAPLDLNAATKSQIQQGVDADDKNQEFWKDTNPYRFINMPGSGVAGQVPNYWHSTVNTYSAASNSTIQIPNHTVHGARLVIQTLNVVTIQIELMTKNQTAVGSIGLENTDREFVWDDSITRWREVF